MKFLPQEIIRLKRDGQILSREQLRDFSLGITSGEVSEAQIAAFAMAVMFQDLNVEERVNWTEAVVDSGLKIDWLESNLPGPILDKHSTGGVGDGVSLMLAPMLAACGAYIPMIAGRGLGHTGGTIDKLEAIPGYNTTLSINDFKRVVSSTGLSIICQTSELAPTDYRVYSVRDVTATVKNTGLITASILSKKIAAGLDSLVLDVKTGNGAVMPNLDASRTLAKALVEVANGAGLKTSALITDMSEPLSFNAGNALEIHESISFLKGSYPTNSRLSEVVYALGSRALVDSGIYQDLESAKDALSCTISSGRALEKFSAMTHAMGGPSDLVERPSTHLAQAPIVRPVYSPVSGYVTSFDVRSLGFTVVSLGGGRTIPGAPIDPSVGLASLAMSGTPVGPPSTSSIPLCVVHAKSDADYEMASKKIINSITVEDEAVNSRPVIHDLIT